MARTVTPLTNTKIKTAKAKEKDYKLFDGGGLFLLITKRNTKLQRLKFKFNGKEKLLALGAYPEISLSRARELRDTNKKLLADGINPSTVKQETKELQRKEDTKNLNTFKVIALQRLKKIKDDISIPHYKGTLRGFVNDTFPHIGSKNINDVTSKDIINILKIMMERNIKNSTQKVYQQIGKTFKYAVAHGIADRNPCNDFDISEIVGKTNEQHYPTITDDKGIKNLLTSIKEYSGDNGGR